MERIRLMKKRGKRKVTKINFRQISLPVWWQKKKTIGNLKKPPKHKWGILLYKKSSCNVEYWILNVFEPWAVFWLIDKQKRHCYYATVRFGDMCATLLGSFFTGKKRSKFVRQNWLVAVGRTLWLLGLPRSLFNGVIKMLKKYAFSWIDLLHCQTAEPVKLYHNIIKCNSSQNK